MKPIEWIAPHNDEEWDRYLECRYRNLYEPFGLPRSVRTSELDSPRDRPDIIHRLARVEGVDVACGRLDLQPGRPEGPSAQLRYFAVDKAYRGSGVGQALLRHIEGAAVAAGAVRLWMYARTAAFNFYARAGYIDIGEGPTLYGSIAHRIMEKRLGSPP